MYICTYIYVKVYNLLPLFNPNFTMFQIQNIEEFSIQSSVSSHWIIWFPGRGIPKYLSISWQLYLVFRKQTVNLEEYRVSQHSLGQRTFKWSILCSAMWCMCYILCYFYFMVILWTVSQTSQSATGSFENCKLRIYSWNTHIRQQSFC